MNSNDSVNFVLRLLEERHRQLKVAVDGLVKVLANDDPAAKKNACKGALQAAADLTACMASKDIPHWLHNIHHALASYQSGNGHPYQMLEALIANKSELVNYKWTLGSASQTFDFDSIFEHYKSQSRLPELFDDILRILEEIHLSGEIDSNSMLMALGKLIATLKRSKEGSYFSLNSAWSFLVSFLKNYLWEELEKLPMLGTAMSALRKAIDETNEEMFKVHHQVQLEMQKVVESEVKALRGKQTFGFVSYDKEGRMVQSNDIWLRLQG